ncbi:MAG: hypothetical protein RL172_1726 [Bacteroidota bacterium]
MQKILLLLGLCFALYNGHAQSTDSTSLPLFDSAAVLKDLMALLGSKKMATSYAMATAGVGNRIFSVRNNRLNARQTIINTAVYTPGAGYFHKSGASITGAAYLLQQQPKGFGASQFSLTPAFDLLGKSTVGLSVSYTHYFVQDKFSPYASPVQNDLFATVSYKKGWLQPGIAMGYSSGKFKEVFSKDTVINNVRRYVYDSATSSLQSFTLMLRASHVFEWAACIHKDDMLLLVPSVVVNFGSSSIDVTHQTNAPRLIDYLIKTGRLPLLITNKFQAESVGLNINCSYAIGNFSFTPQVYLDYYLPQTDSKAFTQSFNFSVGYIF